MERNGYCHGVGELGRDMGSSSRKLPVGVGGVNTMLPDVPKSYDIYESRYS
jgi:hypothetical protein